MKQVGGALDHFLKCQDEDKQQQIASILTNQLKIIESQILRSHFQVDTEKALDDFSYIKSCKAKFVQQPIIEVKIISILRIILFTNSFILGAQ